MKIIYQNPYHFIKSSIEANIQNLIFSSTAAVYGIPNITKEIKESYIKIQKAHMDIQNLF